MYKVVIVDDEDIIVSGLRHMLPWAKYGCEVVGTANDGERAVKLIRHCQPNILFTDIQMPGMDGLAMVAALRSEYPNMQVAILSGYPDFEYARRAILLGVNSYILKPSRMAELEQAVESMVSKLDSLGNTGIPATELLKNSSPGEPKEKAIGTSPTTNNAENAGNFIIRNALQYIESNFSQKLTLGDVAENVYVSQWHLSKLISKTCGQSFSDILNGVRIRKAKQLLENPALKIWEVSEQVGFADVTHFSRIFKKLEKCSANEYRNRLRPAQPQHDEPA